MLILKGKTVANMSMAENQVILMVMEKQVKSLGRMYDDASLMDKNATTLMSETRKVGCSQSTRAD